MLNWFTVMLCKWQFINFCLRAFTNLVCLGIRKRTELLINTTMSLDHSVLE